MVDVIEVRVHFVLGIAHCSNVVALALACKWGRRFKCDGGNAKGVYDALGDLGTGARECGGSTAGWKLGPVRIAGSQDTWVF